LLNILRVIYDTLHRVHVVFNFRKLANHPPKTR
jgi:hypothetical protein